MRIISGTARGRKLRQFKGRQIRPTADRVREALFSSLHSRLGSFDCLHVLDLYAGTGALSLEALSRGAASAVLVDQGGPSAEIIADNIRACGMQDRARFFKTPVASFLAKLPAYGPFDLVFLDPPYNQGLVAPTLLGIVDHRLLSDDGIVCVETSRDEEVPCELAGLTLISQRTYGSTNVLFYSLSNPDRSGPGEKHP